MHRHCRRPNVLIVDDDVTIRSLIEAVLNDSGCHTLTAEHGADALERLDRHHFDVIVLDLNMPVMDGVQFYREMKRQDRLIPTIVLSAEADGPAIARDLGASMTMKKPFDIDDLVSAVLTLYQTGGGGGTGSEDP